MVIKNMEFEYKGHTYSLVGFDTKDSLFIAVSGSHAYGWNREDSDLDIVRVWFPDIKQALTPFFKTKNKQYSSDGLDVKLYPIQQYLIQLNKGNGNALENLFQHHLYEKKKLVESLKRIIMDNLHKGFLRHYLGFSYNEKKDSKIPARIAKYGLKIYLNRYRVLLAGLILEERRKVCFNVTHQQKYIRTQYFCDVIDEYKKGKNVLDSKLKSNVERELDALHGFLEIRIEESDFPIRRQSPTVLLDRWLMKYYVG